MRRLEFRVFLCTLIGVLLSTAVFADEAEQRDSLVAFFHATDGVNWFNDDGWIGEETHCGWFGVWCCDPSPFGCGQTPLWAVLGLDLPNNNLGGSLPAEIGDFHWMKAIELNANQLSGVLPEELGNLDGLWRLWMDNNQFEGSIPVQIGLMTDLTEFSLINNHLDGPIPLEIGNLINLRTLWLGGNELEGEVPRAVWELPRLWSLYLTGNHLSGAIPADARISSSFEGLGIAENRFSGPIPRWLLGLNYPGRFEFGHNALTSEDPEILEFLTEFQEGDWLTTQTLAPAAVRLVDVDAEIVRLEWFGGGLLDLPGHTIIEHALSGGEWTVAGETSGRDVTTFELDRPSDALSHHYRLLTVTDPHENNKNTVTSDPSQIVTFNEAGHIVLPALARLRGHGVDFTSTLNAFNPSETDLEMSLVFTPREDVGGEPKSATWTLEAGRAVTIDDALEYFLGPFGDQPAVGSLVITASAGRPEDLLLTSTITARHPDGSEYGQAFPASTFSESIWPGEIAHIHTTVDAGHSRVNAGLTTLEPATRTRIRLVDPIGTPLSDIIRVFEGDAGASMQLNDVWQIFGVDPVADALLEIDVHQGSVIAYGSVLDGYGDYEGTSDPTTVAPFKEGREIVTLLEMGDIIGHDEFSGSASVSNTADHTITVTAEFHQRGWPGVAATTEFEFIAGQTAGYANIVRDLFGLEDVVGTITLETNANALVASGREFAVQRDDQGEIIGTSGQLIRGLTTADLLWPERSYHLIGLRQDEDPKGHRTNIAAFNPASAEATVTLELFDQATGQSEGMTEITVRGQELVHVNAIIKAINAEHDEAEKRLEIIVSGPVYLQAFRVNPWGDPVTLDVLEER